MGKSLHNIDYKILTESISKRLENVPPKIIILDQIGYVQNRYMASTEETNIPYPGPSGFLLI